MGNGSARVQEPAATGPKDPPSSHTRAKALGPTDGAGAAGGASPSERARGRIRILLAEDDWDLRTALVNLLKFDGYEVSAVANGSELLDALASWILAETTHPPVDVILTDVRMPGFGGLSIVEGLRANGWGQPIIVISAFGDDALRDRIRRLPGVMFLPKPLDLAELDRALAEVTLKRTGLTVS